MAHIMLYRKVDTDYNRFKKWNEKIADNPDCSNTKMSTARSEFSHLIRRAERLPSITI